MIHASSLLSVKSPSAAWQAACDAAVQVLCSKETWDEVCKRHAGLECAPWHLQMTGTTSKRDGSRLSVSQLPACAGFGRDKKRKGLLDWYFNSRASAPKPHEGALARTTPMRIEPKTFFANERTFLSWCARALQTLSGCALLHCGGRSLFSGAVRQTARGRRWARHRATVVC